MSDEYNDGLGDDYKEPTVAKTLDETDKKCPNCGATMGFSAKTGNTFCEYCGYEEEIELDDETLTKAEENVLDLDNLDTKSQDWGTETKAIVCESCGAESIYDALQVAALCPYCGSTQVTSAHTEDTIAPGGVVPFSITDKEASDRFRKWIKKKWFCPKAAKESAKPKSFKGIYLPYWTFDARTESNYRGRYGKDRTVGSGDNKRTVTDWYSTSGTYDSFFDDELVQGSENKDKSMLKGIEPFDTENNKPYKPEYLAGYTAQRYSIPVKEAWEKAKISIDGKIRRGIETKVRREHNADKVSISSIRTSYSDLTYKYLMLPIWNSTFKYKEKIYHFMVNGQTGKVAGKTPISPIRVAIAIVAALALAWIIYQIM